MKLLLSTIGNVRQYSELTYSLAGDAEKSWKGEIAGVAAGVFFGPFDEVLLFCTDETCRFFEKVKGFYQDVSLPEPRKYMIPTGDSPEDQWQIVETVIDAGLDISQASGVPAEITLDITSGYRTLPLLYFTAISYLTSFHDSRLERVVYGLANIRAKSGTLFDVTSAFRVIEWYHAAKMFTKSGDVGSLQTLVENELEELIPSKDEFKDVTSIKKALYGMSGAFGSGLPIELGMAARGIRRELESLESTPASLPLFKHLADDLQNITASCAFDEHKTKATLELTEGEIERELDIIQLSLEYDQVGNAFRMMRETLLNKALLNHNPENWLQSGTRKEVAQRLGALRARAIDKELSQGLTQQEQRIGNLWDKIIQKRNRLAHCGYSQTRVRIQDIEEIAHDILNRIRAIDLSGLWEDDEGKDNLLVCPLGRSKGAMYSALKHTSPDRLLALVSPQTESLLGEVLVQADIPDLAVSKLLVENPYRSFKKIETFVSDRVDVLTSAKKVAVHVVGGTTMMTELSRAFGRKARDLGIPMEIFATIDARTREEQIENPYVVGEYLTLEPWPPLNGA